jgi:starch-binding outer membrane protein, SusD/RagB family
MKKLILYILFFAAIGLFSCTELDEDPRSNISTTNFYRTQSDALAALQSVYSDLTHNTSGDHASIYNRLLVLATGMSSDDHIAGPRATNPDVRSIAALTQSSTNTRYAELWRQHYEGINRANAAIERIPLITGDTVVLNRLVREAKFLRGLYYYNLVRLWGNVPLILTETNAVTGLNVTRTPADEVYAQIIEDLTEASKLPAKYAGADAFRATSGAAKSLLLGVYITRQQWAKAITQYEDIVSGPYGYDLFTNYADIFSVAKKNTVEHIFDASFIADGTGASFNGTGNTNILGIISAPVVVYGADADAPHPGLYQLFKAYDKRRAVTFIADSVLSPIDGKYKPISSPRFKKYWDPASGANLVNSGINVPIIRFAEVVLFYAEAQNELNGPNTEAYTAINRIRYRAGLPDLTAGLSKEQFRDSLYLERRLEFVYEQIRWFDLIRTKRLVPELSKLDDKKNVSEKNYLLAIPASEIIINPNLTQNPGWN